MKYKKGDTVYVIVQDIAVKGEITGNFSAFDEEKEIGINAYFVLTNKKEVVREESRIYSSIKELGASLFRLFPEGMAFIL